MQNRIITLLLLGLSAASMHAGDAYETMNPYESMNPWTPTQGELDMLANRLAATERELEKAKEMERNIEEARSDMSRKFDDLTNDVLSGKFKNKDGWQSYKKAQSKIVWPLDRLWRRELAVNKRVRELRNKQRNLYWNELNKRYYSEPTFPRVERLRGRLSNWINSWYR
jgi:hypothetical protein